MFEKYYTPEQLQQLEERRQQLGDDEIKRVEDEWKDLYARCASTGGRARIRTTPPCRRSSAAPAS